MRRKGKLVCFVGYFCMFSPCLPPIFLQIFKCWKKRRSGVYPQYPPYFKIVVAYASVHIWEKNQEYSFNPPDKRQGNKTVLLFKKTSTFALVNTLVFGGESPGKEPFRWRLQRHGPYRTFLKLHLPFPPSNFPNGTNELGAFNRKFRGKSEEYLFPSFPSHLTV